MLNVGQCYRVSGSEIRILARVETTIQGPMLVVENATQKKLDFWPDIPYRAAHITEKKFVRNYT